MPVDPSRFIHPFYQPGDILGFCAQDCLGITINLATWGLPWVGLSHVAIVAAHPDDGRPVEFESTTLYPRPCVIRCRITEGVQCHDIRPRVAYYRRHHGRVWHYRIAEPLTPEESSQLTSDCIEALGTPYDAIGAFRSREAGLGWLEQRLRKEDLTSIFCSEFVASRLRMIGRFDTDNASRWNPNCLCRAAVRRKSHLTPVEVLQ